MKKSSLSPFPACPPFLLSENRFVIDPANPNQVIDMRHFLVVGSKGETYGMLIEIRQALPGGDPHSAFDDQDFLSNYLGKEFMDNYYDPNGDLSEQLQRYFEGRANMNKKGM